MCCFVTQRKYGDPSQSHWAAQTCVISVGVVDFASFVHSTFVASNGKRSWAAAAAVRAPRRVPVRADGAAVILLTQ